MAGDAGAFTPDDLPRFQTVTEWLPALPPTPAGRRRHLEALARWCAAEGADPDELITRGRKSREEKLEAMRRLRVWVEKEETGERAQQDLQQAGPSIQLF